MSGSLWQQQQAKADPLIRLRAMSAFHPSGEVLDFVYLCTKSPTSLPAHEPGVCVCLYFITKVQCPVRCRCEPPSPRMLKDQLHWQCLPNSQTGKLWISRKMALKRLQTCSVYRLHFRQIDWHCKMLYRRCACRIIIQRDYSCVLNN